MILLLYKLYCCILAVARAYFFPKFLLVNSKVNFGLLCLKGISFSTNGLTFPRIEVINNSGENYNFFSGFFVAHNIDATDIFLVCLLVTLTSIWTYNVFIAPMLISQKTDLIADLVTNQVLDQLTQETVDTAINKYASFFAQPWTINNQFTTFICEQLSRMHFTSTFT